MLMQEKIIQSIKESAGAKEALESLAPDIEKAAKAIMTAMKDEGHLLIAGNGGSASQASHMAGELVGRYLKERKGLPAIALTTDTSVLTAWSNDYGFDTVFSRQIEALGREGDVFLGISTSGNSPNLIKGFEEAKKKGMVTISLLGREGGKTKGLADLELIVPLDSTPRIQECHILLIHILCGLIEEAIS